jgi:hypothetical protein
MLLTNGILRCRCIPWERVRPACRSSDESSPSRRVRIRFLDGSHPLPLQQPRPREELIQRYGRNVDRGGKITRGQPHPWRDSRSGGSRESRDTYQSQIFTWRLRIKRHGRKGQVVSGSADKDEFDAMILFTITCSHD